MSHNERRELTTAGTPYQIGYQHGQAFRRQISNLLQDQVARINYLRSKPLTLNEAMQAALQYVPYIEEYLPEIAEELHGLADGARLHYLEAVLLQIRRELIHSDQTYGDCTSFTLREGGKVVMAQTVDQAGMMREFAFVLKVLPNDPEKPAVCMFTFMGLCGYLGFNSTGLAVGLNMVYSPGWQVGVPVYLLLRHLLTKRSIGEVLGELERIRRASSRYIMVADAERVLGIEMTVREYRIVTDRPLAHANHFLHTDLISVDELKGPPFWSSQHRLHRAQELLLGGAGAVEILKDHEGYPKSICGHAGAYKREVDTVGATIIYPGDRKMLVFIGHPCEETPREYSLR